METPAPVNMRHVLAALVANEPGVLARVAGMFAARGFNIDSLVVGRTENPEFSRMTIVVSGDLRILDQVRKQLGKLVEVVKVVDYSQSEFVERDLMLVRVAAGDANRSAIVELTNLFRGKVVDVARDQLTIELSGTEDKVEAFIDMVAPYGIIELARTGLIAMPRGGDAPVTSAPKTMRHTGSADARNKPSDVDPSQLPPG